MMMMNILPHRTYLGLILTVMNKKSRNASVRQRCRMAQGIPYFHLCVSACHKCLKVFCLLVFFNSWCYPTFSQDLFCQDVLLSPTAACSLNAYLRGKRLIKLYVCVSYFYLWSYWFLKSLEDKVFRTFFFSNTLLFFFFLHSIEHASLASPPGHGHLSAHDSSLLKKKETRSW